MAQKALIIVESPTKAKTLGRFLGSDYTVEASMGHLRDLPKSKLGVDVENHFKPEYVQVKGKGDLINKLKKLSAKAEIVYLAMDPDREGEAIAWHTAALLTAQEKGKKHARAKKGAGERKFYRVTFHEITKTAIAAAMEHPGDINHNLVDAQQARRVLDRLVGYSLSPVLWRKVRRGLSAGRVQSVALRLITEREKEIEAFTAQEYWVITVALSKEKEGFSVELVEIAGKPIVIAGQGKGISLDSEKVVKPIIADLKKASYVVERVEKKERKRSAYPPFTTSTLQQAGANVLGWSAKMTMQIAQQLYEAGLITYHRTDSVNLAAEAVAAARTLITNEYGAEYLPEQAVTYATKSKNAQEAHEAIRPTEPSRMSLSEEKNGFTERHEKLYKLIWRRFVACQMKAAVYDQTSVVVSAGEKYRLKANGSIVKFPGWRKAYGRANADAEVTLPALSVGEKPAYVDLTAEQKATEPPPRFNDASLIKELEKRGIGRPSTYAPTISTLIVRGYMERRERRFYPSAIGMTVVPFLSKHFKEIMDYDFTAEMEEDLDRIARGEKEWEKVMGSFWKPFDKTVKEVAKEAKRVEIPVEKTGEKCPTCGEGEVVVRTGRFGKFKSCSRFPECKYTASFTETLEGVQCPDCGGDVQVKRTHKGRMFYGCSNYPTCHWASWQDPRKEQKK